MGCVIISFIPTPCPPLEECCSVTITGFCLEDGTSIGIVVQEEEQIGWFDLFTGVFTPGPPPAGTHTCPSNVVSTANSTSTPLAAGGTFTGAFEEVLPYADFTVLINTDQPSAVDGFVVEYSTDGINVDAADTFTFLAPAGKQYSFGVNSRYVRITYENGATPHTTFRLQTIYKRFRGKPSSHKLDESIVDDDDAELVKAILTGKREDGVYENVELSTNNALKIALADRTSEVRDRIHVDTFLENVTVFPATVHTVTPGRIFYLLSISLTGLNTSTTVNGRVVVRDNLTIKLPYLIGQASTGAPGPIAIAPASFLEPIPFTTNVNVQSLAGVNTVSLYIVGYEE